MFPTHTYLKPGAHPYPHVGKFIRRKLMELHVSPPEAARRIGVNTSTVHAYFRQPSLQFGIIWKLSMALNYDLLSDLISSYPPNFPVKPNEKLLELEKEVDVLYRQVDDRCIVSIATQQPMAGDLRFLVSTLKIAPEIERIAGRAWRGRVRSTGPPRRLAGRGSPATCAGTPSAGGGIRHPSDPVDRRRGGYRRP